MSSERPEFNPETQTKTIELAQADGAQTIRYADRPGEEPALLCLHGLGSTNDDFAPLTHHPEIASRRVVAWNAPGSGGSPYSRSLTIEDLRDLVLQLRESLGLEKPLLIGHSMGGLTALLAARARPELFGGFLNLEGNLTPEDCGVFSRAADALCFERFEGRFFPWLELEFERSPCAGFPEFSRRFRRNVTERAFWDYCRSIVRICDAEPLLSDYCALPMLRIFVYGSENRSLPAAVFLRGAGARVEEVPSSNHFPLDSNPEFTLNVLARFCDRATEEYALA